MRTIIDEAVCVTNDGWVLSAELLSEAVPGDQGQPEAMCLRITTPDDDETQLTLSLHDLAPLRALFGSELREVLAAAPPLVGVLNVEGRRSISEHFLSAFVDAYNVWAEDARAVLNGGSGK